ncbi:MAG: fumarylacetoacetate hydrolase family protein [Nitrospira sp.]|nr:fumarylacetoacetate hydrolase family protein [Nitrospira sp.]
MKIVRFQDLKGDVHYGEWIKEWSALLIEKTADEMHQVTDHVVAIDKLLAPVEPPSILCVGLNYRRHAEETGARIPEYPVLFIKAVNALAHPGAPVVIPKVAPGQVDCEGELAVVIGKPGKNIQRHQALDHVLGYTCANDVSARRWQKEGGGKQWCRGKSFDTFCPLGPCLVTADEIPDPNTLRIKTTVNDKVMQDSTTADMIFDVPSLVSFLSEGTTLLPGTVILTGTPQGVGFARNPPVFLKQGDRVAIEIERIGTLVNPVSEEE